MKINRRQLFGLVPLLWIDPKAFVAKIKSLWFRKDPEAELVQMLSDEIIQEINKEIMRCIAVDQVSYQYIARRTYGIKNPGGELVLPEVYNSTLHHPSELPPVKKRGLQLTYEVDIS